MDKHDKNTAIHLGWDDFEPFDPSKPEKNLLRAVLITAMSDLRKGGDPARKAREFFLNSDHDYLFAFQSICNHLDIDPKLVMMVTGLYPKRADAELPLEETATLPVDEAEAIASTTNPDDN